MANKKKIDCTQVKGIEMTITKNPYGDRIEKLLEFPMHITKNENGEYVAYYFDKDTFDGEIDYAQRRDLNFEFKKKDVILIDKVPSYLSRHEMSFESFVDWMGQSVETEYNMSGIHSAENKAKRKECGKVYGKNDLNEWGEPERYDTVKVFSTNQYKTNGWCA